MSHSTHRRLVGTTEANINRQRNILFHWYWLPELNIWMLLPLHQISKHSHRRDTVTRWQPRDKYDGHLQVFEELACGRQNRTGFFATHDNVQKVIRVTRNAQLNTKKNFLTKRALQQWNWLPWSEDSPSLVDTYQGCFRCGFPSWTESWIGWIYSSSNILRLHGSDFVHGYYRNKYKFIEYKYESQSLLFCKPTTTLCLLVPFTLLSSIVSQHSLTISLHRFHIFTDTTFKSNSSLYITFCS